MPDSNPVQRHDEVKKAYKDAFNNKKADLKAAKSEDQVEKILRNLEIAERSVLEAAASELERNGPAIETAFLDAKAANIRVSQARAQAVALAEIILSVTQAVNATKALVKAAK